MKYFLLIVSLILMKLSFSADSLLVKKNTKLNTQSLLSSNPINIKTDSTQFKTPKYKQGIICNFEDQLNRKKVPIDFSLGNNKY